MDRNRCLDIDRRRFIQSLMAGACIAAFPGTIPLSASGKSFPSLTDQNGTSLLYTPAMHFTKLEGQEIRCDICPRKCTVANKERGYCGVKENVEGDYYTLVHSRPCSLNIDPIEKKPLYHYYPRAAALSLATAGCNMMCKFCQNWQISQVRPEQLQNRELPPESIISICQQKKVPIIAYTYSEPVVFYEYMYDIARLGKTKGLKSVMISNGYIQEKAMVDLARHLDAVKIDFKAYNEKFYHDICRGHLEPVLETLKTLKKVKLWFELVYLMIPDLNDDLNEIRDMSQWIVRELGPDVPLHFSRFYPQYQLQNIHPTPIAHLTKARDIAMKEGIRYVYVGNIPRHDGENTYCYACKKIVVERHGYLVKKIALIKKQDHHVCQFCEAPIAGLWS